MKIQTEAELRDLYGHPTGRAKLKQLSALEQHSINFIQLSPFAVLATASARGQMDCSPRGGEPGFVKVLGPNRLILPDSMGNNRLDSLVNIIESGVVGAMFMIPGVDETLRINGKASLSTDGGYLDIFAQAPNPPKCVIDIEIEEVFLHCAKALMRSKLWASESHVDRKSLPTMGQMINDQLGDSSAPECHEAMVKRYLESL